MIRSCASRSICMHCCLALSPSDPSDHLSAFVCSAFLVCSIVFSIRVFLDPRRGSRITHCADENPGVPTSRPESRSTPVPAGIHGSPPGNPGVPFFGVGAGSDAGVLGATRGTGSFWRRRVGAHRLDGRDPGRSGRRRAL